jgi:hypothetical protein
MSTELAKTINSTLCPDLQQAGSLEAALQAVLRELRTDLIVQQRLIDVPFIVYATVRRADRASHVMVASHQRAFSVDFWNQGVQYGSGWAADLKDVGRGIVAFHVHAASLHEMTTRFAWFKVNTSAAAHEAGPERFVAEAWRGLQNRLKEDKDNGDSLASELLTLVVEASRRPKLRQLLPVRSLYYLGFSRTTGYPYTRDCPPARPIGAGRFRVVSPDEKLILGEGDAVQAADVLVATLPRNCGPAIHGTAENLNE